MYLTNLFTSKCLSWIIGGWNDLYLSSFTDPAFKDTADPTISSGYVNILNDTFKAVTQPLTWEAANARCESEGNQLATLQSEWSQVYVELVALTLKTPVWIGMNRDKVKGGGALESVCEMSQGCCHSLSKFPLGWKPQIYNQTVIKNNF